LTNRVQQQYYKTNAGEQVTLTKIPKGTDENRRGQVTLYRQLSKLTTPRLFSAGSSQQPPCPPIVPTTVWINPPMAATKSQEVLH
jgi:hypothetical protein